MAVLRYFVPCVILFAEKTFPALLAVGADVWSRNSSYIGFMCVPTTFILSSVRSGVEFWMLTAAVLSSIALSPNLTSFIPYVFNQLSISCLAVLVSTFPHHPSPISGEDGETAATFSPASLHFCFLFFSSAGFWICISCLGNNDIYFLSRFERAVITVCLLLSLISWLKRSWLMRKAWWVGPAR